MGKIASFFKYAAAAILGFGIGTVITETIIERVVPWIISHF